MVWTETGSRNVDKRKTVDLSNPLYEYYYKNQLMLDDVELEKFVSVMRADLPVTFRVTGFRQLNRELLTLLQENYLSSIISKMADEPTNNVATVPLKWYPGNTAWQINASRPLIRKTPELVKLHSFLVSESEAGNLSRQEAVSMLPPLLLNIKEHHSILDLCAAPGSKSAQLVELLHSAAESRCTDADRYAEPSGIVVANDFDRKRCYMLVHQIKRLQSPCVILTEEDASIYPRLFVNLQENPSKMKQMQFDRILADVPCSGDGTLRKSPDIWARWTPKIGRGHHELQKRILRRGLELLRVPDSSEDPDLPRLVYSTCSLNPIEDEAVIASILVACKGAVRLIEPDLICLPGSEEAKSGGFIARPGLKTWRVMLGSDKWYSKHDEIPEKERSSVRPSLFPPESVEQLHLDHCRRVLPHDQNTGGFFVAVLEKVADLPWMNSRQNSIKKLDNTDNATEACTESQPPAKRARLGHSKREESLFVFMDPATDQDWPSIRNFYGLDKKDSCVCSLDPSQILYRKSNAGDPVRRRNLYYTNPLVKAVIQANANVVNFVNGGVRLFAYCDDKQFVGYRLLHDGIHLACAFLPQVPRNLKQYPPQLCYRRLCLSMSERNDLILLLLEETPLVERFSKATQNQLEQFSVGPVLIDYDPSAPSDPSHVPLVTEGNSRLRPYSRLVFSGWRGARSLRNYIDRHERTHFLRLCGLDPSVPLITGRSGSDVGKGENSGDPTKEAQ